MEHRGCLGGSLEVSTLTVSTVLYRVSDSISLNAAVFAAVCLASRLPSSLDTFSLLLCAMELFVFFPNFRRTVKVTMQSLSS